MIYHNILSNPTLQTVEDNLHVEVIHELGFPKQFIYHPVQWRTTVIPTVNGQYTKRQTDMHIIPTVWPQTISGTVSQVLTIEASFKHFVVKLEQSKIPLKAHQRYLVKVTFNPDINLHTDGGATDLAWRVTLDKRGEGFTDGFQSAANVSDWGSPRSALLVLHSNEAQSIDLAVEFWSKFGNLGEESRVHVHAIEVLEVPADYGEGGSVHFVGTATTDPPTIDPPVDPPPVETVIPTLPAWAVFVLAVVGAIIVGVVFYSITAPRLASAQEASVMEELLNQLFAIPSVSPIMFTGGLILFLVELGKKLKSKYLPNILIWLTPKAMVIGWVFFFMLMYAIAEQYSYANVLKDFALIVTKLIAVIGPYVLGAIVLPAGVQVVHKQIRKINVPGFDQ